MSMTEREKMLAGLNYDPGDPELVAGRARAVGLTQGQLNQACGDQNTVLPSGLRIPAC